MFPSIALVEDDLALRSALHRGLEEAGFRLWCAVGTGAEFLSLLDHGRPDCVVLDIGLPDADGRDVLIALRTRGVDVPVLLLTARGALDDKIAGFHSGADDYLVKPFDLEELMVRITALSRRAVREPEAPSQQLVLDAERHCARFAGRSVELSPNELRLLATLLRANGAVVRRRTLTTTAWVGGMASDNSLDVFIGRLRRKLAAIERADALVTVRGVGYRLVP